jgi:TRAP-type C4-dicarboxylate transport system permease small subunit
MKKVIQVLLIIIFGICFLWCIGGAITNYSFMYPEYDLSRDHAPIAMLWMSGAVLTVIVFYIIFRLTETKESVPV